MIKYGAEIDHKRKDGADCVYLAAQNNKLEILKIILPNNPQLVNRHLFKGLTILHTAAKNGNYDVVKYILEKSTISVNDNLNVWSFTSLGVAIQYKGDLMMVKLLINFGANQQQYVRRIISNWR